MTQTEPATAKIIASSFAPNGARIDTVQTRYWRPIHGETMTHRVFSRNGGSGSAVPVASILERDEAYIPKFRKNKPGMSPGNHLSEEEQMAAEQVWRHMIDTCREGVRVLSDKNGLNIHKQWPNRAIEWFGYIDVLITSTEWSNFDGLRRHADAQDEMRALADAVYDARESARPVDLKPGEWHLPYVKYADREIVAKMVRDARIPEIGLEVLQLLTGAPKLGDAGPVDRLLLATSAARACRVSYAKMDGSATDFESDMKRYLGLARSQPLHASPLEHQARGLTLFDDKSLQGNLYGFVQFRKCVPGETM